MDLLGNASSCGQIGEEWVGTRLPTRTQGFLVEEALRIGTVFYSVFGCLVLRSSFGSKEQAHQFGSLLSTLAGRVLL